MDLHIPFSNDGAVASLKGLQSNLLDSPFSLHTSASPSNSSSFLDSDAATTTSDSASLHPGISLSSANRKRSTSVYSIWNENSGPNGSPVLPPHSNNPTYVEPGLLNPNTDPFLNLTRHSRGLSESSGQSSFISSSLAPPSLVQNPTLPPASLLQPTVRNRSYTTSAAPSGPLSLPSMINLNAFQAQIPQSNADHLNSQVAFHHGPDPFPGMHGDSTAPGFVEPLPSMIDGSLHSSYEPQIVPSRIRSQTYSGGTPTLPEASLNLVNDHKLSRDLGFYRPQLGGADPMNLARIDHDESARADFPDPNQPTAIMGSPFSGHGAEAHAAKFKFQSRNSGEKQLMLIDDVDFRQFPITTSFENPSLGPTPLLLFDNLPQSIEALKLYFLLHNSLVNQRMIGSILSVRVASTTTSKLALIEASSVETAMTLKASFNHFDMAPGIVLYVAFARYLDVGRANQPSPEHVPMIAVSDIDARPNQTSHKVSPSASIRSHKTHDSQGAVLPSNHSGNESELIDLAVALNDGPERIDLNKFVSIVHHALPFKVVEYCQQYGNLPEPVSSRQFESLKLRELKSMLEDTEKSTAQMQSSGTALVPMTQMDLEELCLAMLEELPELTYDYLGNTIVQKLFMCLESPAIKLMMVKRIAPFFPQLSIHKNGTWAIQKIINTAATKNSRQEKSVIAEALKPYTVKLFNDQFGNYVLQSCARFGSPYNDFIFEALLDHFVEISSGRFGARCIRTLLEISRDEAHSCVTKEQQLIITSMIVKFARELALNSNGLLLITWLLDTGRSDSADKQVQARYRMIIDELLPDIVALATHKTGHLAILKLLGLPLSFGSRELILGTIFGSYDMKDTSAASLGSLEQILVDFPEGSSGPSFIHKVLSNPLCISSYLASPVGKLGACSLERHLFYASQVRKVLLGLNLNNISPFKKLMEEVGLSSVKSAQNSFNPGKRNKRGLGRSGNKNLGQAHKALDASAQYVAPGVSANASYYNDPGYMYYSGEPQAPHNMRQAAYSQQMMYRPVDFSPMYPMPAPISEQQIYQRRQQQQQQQKDSAVMAQLEQLSLSSAAMGYNSQPNTPQLSDEQRSRF